MSIKSELVKQADQIRDKIADGVSDFMQYRELVMKRKGLLEAIRLIDEQLKRMKDDAAEAD